MLSTHAMLIVLLSVQVAHANECVGELQQQMGSS